MSGFPLFTPDLPRRRLLTALALAPLLCSLPGRAEVTINLQRIIALEWLPTELLLTLGITPLGVADIRNYRLWVGEPALPAQVIDVGQRMEPNLELLQQLKPSLLLLSQGYGPRPEKLASIAPSMSFSFTDGDGQPLQAAQQSLLALAQRLGLMALAQRHLTEFDAFMAAARMRLMPYRAAPLLLFSLLDARHALVMGQGSLFQDVLNRVGLSNAWQGETNFWGSAIVGIERLASVGCARALCFAHGDSRLMAQIGSTPLWQALPFVRQGKLSLLPPVWFYGATLSAMRFCRLLEHALQEAP